MSWTTKKNEEEDADNDLPLAEGQTLESAEAEEAKPAVVDYRPKAEEAAKLGTFFHIYKPGQGYWTRMGTAATCALLGAGLAWFLYTQPGPYMIKPLFFNLQVRTELETDLIAKRVSLGISLGFLAAYAIIIWRLINKPSNVDFLIATDSEMKKVNWTSRKELLGSTKVIIAFMLLIAAFLFVMDIAFGSFFRMIHVLKISPFGT